MLYIKRFQRGGSVGGGVYRDDIRFRFSDTIRITKGRIVYLTLKWFGSHVRVQLVSSDPSPQSSSKSHLQMFPMFRSFECQNGFMFIWNGFLPPSFEDAIPICASEFVIGARGMSRGLGGVGRRTVLFVISIPTILLSIAMPRHRYANREVPRGDRTALELIRATLGLL